MLELAAALGADVSAQLRPGRWLATGAGEQLQELPAPAGELALLLVPFAEGLATARVYQEADRLGAPRTPAELERLRRGAERPARVGRGAAERAAAAGQRPPGGRDLAVSGDRARAGRGP